MGLPRLIVWLLVVIWVAAFVCFVVVSQIAFVSGTTFEYRLYGIQFPFLAFALMACKGSILGTAVVQLQGCGLQRCRRNHLWGLVRRVGVRCGAELNLGLDGLSERPKR